MSALIFESRPVALGLLRAAYAREVVAFAEQLRPYFERGTLRPYTEEDDSLAPNARTEAAADLRQRYGIEGRIGIPYWRLKNFCRRRFARSETDAHLTLAACPSAALVDECIDDAPYRAGDAVARDVLSIARSRGWAPPVPGELLEESRIDELLAKVTAVLPAEKRPLELPKDASPVLGELLSAWFDSLHRQGRRASDEDRRALEELARSLVGTAGQASLERRRTWRVVDWLVRTALPAIVEPAGFEREANKLRALPRITGPLDPEHVRLVRRVARLVDRKDGHPHPGMTPEEKAALPMYRKRDGDPRWLDGMAARERSGLEGVWHGLMRLRWNDDLAEVADHCGGKLFACSEPHFAAWRLAHDAGADLAGIANTLAPSVQDLFHELVAMGTKARARKAA